MINQRKNTNNILSQYKDDSPESVEFRRIYTKLNNLGPSNHVKKIMITSSISGEGKSTISSLLAITCARYNSGTTLLVDCDLRRPNIHKIISLPKEKGLAEILKGEMTPLETIKDTNLENLKIITGGELKERPSKLLNSSRIVSIFAELQPNFETIILDTPPVIPVSDSLILSVIADITLVIIKAGKTQKEVAKRAIELLKDTKVSTVGILVNNLANMLPYYYNYNYYRYKYNS